MKTVCLKCNRPLEHHKQITAELVESVKGATFDKPILGFRSPLSPLTVGQWIGHDPMMSTKEPTWEIPFGYSEYPILSALLAYPATKKLPLP